MRFRLVPVAEGRVRRGVVAIGLPPTRGRNPLFQADRVDQRQRSEKSLGVAVPGQCLRVTQVRGGVLQTDLATEERGRLRALEDLHRSAPVGRRPVEQTRAVGTEQMFGNNSQVGPGLFGRQEVS